MRLRIVAAGMLAFALLLALVLVMSSGPNPNAMPSTEEVAERIMSPYCTGLLVAECPTRQSAELRSRIDEKVKMAWTNRQIDEWLVANYGEQILGRPRGVVSWIVPLGAAVFGLVVLISILRRRKQAPESLPEEKVDAAVSKRVKADLERFAGEVTE